jgi:hypothetical protein
MGVLTDDEQNLLTTGENAIPNWFVLEEDPEELLAQAAVIIGNAKTQLDAWLAATYILKAGSFWLDQHARDRGTRRQNSESDATLAQRLRVPTDQVTLPALKALINTAMTLAGVAGTCAIVEVRRHKAFVHTTGVNPAGAFATGGWRVGYPQPVNNVVVILPYLTPTLFANAVTELMRLNKAAGILVSVEIRLHP